MLRTLRPGCYLALADWNSRDLRAKPPSFFEKLVLKQLLERLWGEHIHLGFYALGKKNVDFREAKVQFVHELVKWSGLDKLPQGSRILDVGCGIGGSSRILAKYYGFNVTGITISPAQVKRARELTSLELSCTFQVMDALDLKFEDGSFDAIWSVEAGAHMNDKKKFADEMLRTLRPGGFLAFHLQTYFYHSCVHQPQHSKQHQMIHLQISNPKHP